MSRLCLRRVLLLSSGVIGTAAAAQTTETSSFAQPEPEIPIIWLAPPPTDIAIEDQRLPVLTLVLPPPPNPNAVALPPAARALLEQAMSKGSAESFAAVEKLARDTYPNGGAQIDAIAAENAANLAEKKASEARAKADALAEASFLDNWKGEAEIGGSLQTGNTHNIAVYGSLKLTREGIHWRNALTARADFQKTDGITSTDRDSIAYQPQYKFDERMYVYGLGQFEHDRFTGYDQRYTAGTGLGYRVLPGPRLQVDLEGGPAVRQTRFIDSDHRTDFAGRGSLNVAWKPNPNVQLTQTTQVYFETGNNNIVSTTALDTKLFGPLKARLSYNITYERETTDSAKNLDTTSRASLVYSF